MSLYDFELLPHLPSTRISAPVHIASTFIDISTKTQSYITKIKHHSEILSQFFSILQRIEQMSALVPSKSSKMHTKLDLAVL